MIDVVDSATRSRMMAGILSKNTKPELTVRRYLHSCGYRYRLYCKKLPGTPDLVLSKYKLAIFVHGCFWHRHYDCFYSILPATRSGFWSEKLSRNVDRDRRQLAELTSMGWRVLIIWECGLKHRVEGMGEIVELIGSAESIMEWPIIAPRKKLTNK